MPAARYAEMDGQLSKRDLIAEVRALHLSSGDAEVPHPVAEANGVVHGMLSLPIYPCMVVYPRMPEKGGGASSREHNNCGLHSEGVRGEG